MLKECKFSDLYIGEDAAWLAGVPMTKDPVPLPPEYLEEAISLRDKCKQILLEKRREDFQVRHAGVQYRASVINSIAETVFVLRRFSDVIPNLEQLGIHKTLVERLMTHPVAGLIVVSGAFGNGKTTTASSIVVSRLTKYGGVAVTVENPPEMPLEGRHGEGVCYQTEADKGEFAEACRKATRWAPSIIFLGEIRDSETALEALRASVNGRLVICTTHSEHVVGAIERIHALATSTSSDSEDVAHLLSAGLTCVLHQKLEDNNGQKQLRIQFLWVPGRDESDEQGIRSMISSKKFNQLKTIIDQQRNEMVNA